MIDQLMTFSVRNKFVIGVFVVALIGWGVFATTRIPVDAVPDITNNQVQIITTTSNLATLEVEKFLTSPIELSMQSLPGVEEIRSISRFGLSVVTVVFDESMGIYLPRQLVSERLQEAQRNIPEGIGSPEMAPITTGLGEIYQYILRPEDGYEDQYTSTDLRTIQDWIVKRQLLSVDGVIEVNTLGGHLKQYEVAINPGMLKASGVTIGEVLMALEESNENTGGAYIQKDPYAYYIRSEGIVKSLEDIGEIVIKTIDDIPILIRHIAEVGYGHAPRYGATTYNAKGEVVSGLVLMLKGENSARVTNRVEEKVELISKTLPEGVVIEPFLVRSELIGRALHTVEKNLIEGGLIVIFILVLLLGNFRAGLIVASVIPLSMLFALGMMHVLGISANLMSLGAIDFGLIVDGAVIIVESIVHRIQTTRAGSTLTKSEMDHEVLTGAIKIRSSAAFGEVIILMVYLPILALTGIEGKMFSPMAMTVGLAITGALILSLTYVPMMSALFLNRTITNKKTIADRIMGFFHMIYNPVRTFALRFKGAVIIGVIALFVWSLWIFNNMGGEFIPTLEEGDFALHQILPPGSSLDKSIEVSGKIQQKLLDNFPEVKKVVTKIGAAEVPIDPMPVETGDIMVIMEPKKDWVSAKTRQAMFDTMETVLSEIPGINYEFTQPIQMRFNELMTGARGDIAVKIFGADLDILYHKAKEAEGLLSQMEGLSSVKVEQVTGMSQIVVRYDYRKLAQYGIHVKDVNRLIRTAFAGEVVSTIFEEDRRFDLVVRLDKESRVDISNVEDLYITLKNKQQVPLREIAQVQFEEAPQQISRDDAKRRIVISVNAGGKDTETLVEEMQKLFEENLELPPGYHITYGGQFENLLKARARLMVAVPVALFIIFVLLYLTFGSVSQALLIFTAIPLSAIGGIWALWLRDMPFSISAGIGFIALFGVAVLNGIVLIGYFNRLKKEGMKDVIQRVIIGTTVRLRPVIMTASVASFGFLPMALSNTAGAEVQRPLATVVIGGLLTATVLTLVVLPILYLWLDKWNKSVIKPTKHLAITVGMLLIGVGSLSAQVQKITLEDALQLASEKYPTMKVMDLMVQKKETLLGIGAQVQNTQFYYSSEGLGGDPSFEQHNFGVQQSFNWFGTSKMQNELREEQYILSTQNKELIQHRLNQRVASVYTDWLALREKGRTLQEFDSIYVEFVRIADSRYESGETNSLESVAATNKLHRLRLLLDQNEEIIEQAHYQLQILTQSENGLEPSRDQLVKLDIQIEDSSILLHPVIQFFNQKGKVANAQTNVLKKSFAANYTLGYEYERFWGAGGFSGVYVGLSVPLFRKTQNKNLEASAMQAQIAEFEADASIVKLEAKLNKLERELNKYAAAIDFYEDSGVTFHEQLVELSRINYSAGEISYSQYIQSLDQAFQLRLEYLENLRQYNQIVIQINYITLLD